MSDEIEFSKAGAIGTILLNAPQRLNALSMAMCGAIGDRLAQWRDEEAIRAVVIKGAGERAFCSGGDIRSFYEMRKAGDIAGAKRFFATEYRDNWRVAMFPKPYVALMNGIVMGGGVGVACHGRFRIATEKSVFAMPECGIGLYPDVGGSYLLPRLPGRSGRYLGLTGASIGPRDMLGLGLATHFAPSERLPALEARLSELDDWWDGAAEAVEAVLDSLHAVPGGDQPVVDARHELDEDFAHDSVEAILEALDARDSVWSREAAAMIRAKSPTSLKLTLASQILGGEDDFETCLQREYAITARLVEGTEFMEGVRAQIIDKDRKPAWSPATLAEVDDDWVQRMMTALPPGEALTFDWDQPTEPRA